MFGDDIACAGLAVTQATNTSPLPSAATCTSLAVGPSAATGSVGSQAACVLPPSASSAATSAIGIAGNLRWMGRTEGRRAASTSVAACAMGNSPHARHPFSVEADLNDRRVARERELKKREENEVEFGRIVAFSDGVFSIAITLLVLAIGVDNKEVIDEGLAQALWNQHEAVLAYAISFAVIGRFWVLHHGFFGEVKGFDSRLIALNMFYLGWIVLIPFSSQVLGEYGGQLPAIVLYAANLTGVVLVGQWMRSDARRAGLADIDDSSAREDLISSLFIVIVFLFSIVVALFDARIAPYIWLLLFFEGRGHVIERLNRRL
ncbi:MAG TPA: TMEM175 family protein [Solirubrobacterales bacterium]